MLIPQGDSAGELTFSGSAGTGDLAKPSEIEGKVIRQYGYIFSALDADISRSQSTALAYVVYHHPTVAQQAGAILH